MDRQLFDYKRMFHEILNIVTKYYKYNSKC